MEKELFTYAGNPLFTHKYTCDPTAITYAGKLFLYTGHDEAGVGEATYVMNNWLCFSTQDLVEWEEYPSPLKAKDFSWASDDAYASCVVHHNDKFYWFVAVSHASITGKAIGLAVSDRPEGPFKDALGAALISHNMLPSAAGEKANLDPSVLIDHDGQAYIFWGYQQCYYARLKPDLRAIDGPISIIPLPGFSEGAHIHERSGWYYLSYGYGYPEKVAYAMSRHPEGPWEFTGILNEIPGNCATNRPAIIRFNGQDYFIYHNGALKNGGSHRRSICIDRLEYNQDGTMQRVIMTSEGILPVGALKRQI